MYGSLQQGKARMYPEDCIQSIIKPSDWWIKNEKRKLCRGSLVFAFIPHVDQVPYTVKPVGRKKADDHSTALLEISPLRINQVRDQTTLPVAAMTLHDGEIWTAYRAKKRPCLVLGSSNQKVAKSITRGMANRHSAPTILVAPYYGVDRDGKRAGYRPEFVERIRHCEYPQFIWDKLPISGAFESILRLDHLQPIGTHYNSYETSEFMLSNDAITIIDELIHCQIWGGVPEDGFIMMYRNVIEDTFND